MDKYQILTIALAILLILIIIVLSSRVRIYKTYQKYMKVGNKADITGKQLAFFSKQKLGLDDLSFSLTDKKLGDAYSPKYKTLILSKEVCDTASLASMAIVAHELGHAMQDDEKKPLFVFVRVLGYIVRFTNKFILPMLIVGLFLYAFKYPTPDLGYYFIISAIILFILNILNQILNIPIEFDASKRALKFLKENKIVSTSELRKAKKLLTIAGQTYIAGLFDNLFIITRRKK